MRFRTAHLAYVLLLLSTLGAAEAHAQAAGANRYGEHFRILLQQAASISVEDAYGRASAKPLVTAIPGEPVAHVRAAWTMRPPAAHTAAHHAVTGSSL